MVQTIGWRKTHLNIGPVKGWVTPIQGTPGFPDIIAFKEVDGWIKGALAWELKATRGKVTAEQVEWLRLFELAGFHARVWTEDEEDELIKLVESWQQRR